LTKNTFLFDTEFYPSQVNIIHSIRLRDGFRIILDQKKIQFLVDNDMFASISLISQGEHEGLKIVEGDTKETLDCIYNQLYPLSEEPIQEAPQPEEENPPPKLSEETQTKENQVENPIPEEIQNNNVFFFF
jgi:hypothetical protein